MKFFFLFAVLMVLLFVSASGFSDVHQLKANPIKKSPGKVGTASYPGVFPTSPPPSSSRVDAELHLVWWRVPSVMFVSLMELVPRRSNAVSS
jgi:hypothetical protein